MNLNWLNVVCPWESWYIITGSRTPVLAALLATSAPFLGAPKPTLLPQDPEMRPENPLCGWDPIYVYLSGRQCHNPISVPSWVALSAEIHDVAIFLLLFHPSLRVCSGGEALIPTLRFYNQSGHCIIAYCPLLTSLPELSPNGTGFNEYLNSLSSEISFILPLSLRIFVKSYWCEVMLWFIIILFVPNSFST